MKNLKDDILSITLGDIEEKYEINVTSYFPCDTPSFLLIEYGSVQNLQLVGETLLVNDFE